MKESSSAEERETTMRSFFKPDLLSVASTFPEEFPLLKEIDKVQESLGNNKNFLVQTLKNFYPIDLTYMLSLDLIIILTVSQTFSLQ